MWGWGLAWIELSPGCSQVTGSQRPMFRDTRSYQRQFFRFRVIAPHFTSSATFPPSPADYNPGSVSQLLSLEAADAAVSKPASPDIVQLYLCSLLCVG